MAVLWDDILTLIPESISKLIFDIVCPYVYENEALYTFIFRHWTDLGGFEN